MEEKINKLKDWLGSGSINLFGKPFSGKDTQGERLADSLDASLVGGGDILRHLHEGGEIDKVMTSGGLIPSNTFFELVLPYLSKDEFKGRSLILDSVGRSHGEEETVFQAAEQSGHPIKAAVLITLPEEQVWKRFDASREQHDRDGRQDDKGEVIKTRLEKFDNNTVPVIEYYRQKNLLVVVNGDQARDEVFRELIEKLSDFTTQSAG